jgi:hypothetical protein
MVLAAVNLPQDHTFAPLGRNSLVAEVKIFLITPPFVATVTMESSTASLSSQTISTALTTKKDVTLRKNSFPPCLFATTKLPHNPERTPIIQSIYSK